MGETSGRNVLQKHVWVEAKMWRKRETRREADKGMSYTLVLKPAP
jgi:hypothetical protein